MHKKNLANPSKLFLIVILGLITTMCALNDTVRDVFKISIPLAEENSLGRKSWDETAI
jgi:hypothetical protein